MIGLKREDSKVEMKIGPWIKNIFFILLLLTGVLYSRTLLSQVPTKAKEPLPPSDYGSIVLGRYAERYEPKYLKKVVFPHWFHRIRFKCNVCHSDIGFTMKVGADDIRMTEIFEGKWCGRCHNGKIAFIPYNCSRCHSLGRGRIPENHKIEEILNDLPGNRHGNKVDWVKALNGKKIEPKADLGGIGKMLVFDRDIHFKLQGPPMPFPEVIFPHKQHTQWLFCNNCHPQIFKMKAGANPVTMVEIFKGRFCGVCHGKVAFPLADCFRCHNKERLEASYEKKIKPALRE